MRIVVDTNIFVSAALKESSWPGELARWLDGHDGLLKTTATEAQGVRRFAAALFHAEDIAIVR